MTTACWADMAARDLAAADGEADDFAAAIELHMDDAADELLQEDGNAGCVIAENEELEAQFLLLMFAPARSVEAHQARVHALRDALRAAYLRKYPDEVTIRAVMLARATLAAAEEDLVASAQEARMAA